MLDVAGGDGIDAIFNGCVDGFMVAVCDSGWREDEHIEVED